MHKEFLQDAEGLAVLLGGVNSRCGKWEDPNPKHAQGNSFLPRNLQEEIYINEKIKE